MSNPFINLNPSIKPGPHRFSLAENGAELQVTFDDDGDLIVGLDVNNSYMPGEGYLTIADIDELIGLLTSAKEALEVTT